MVSSVRVQSVSVVTLKLSEFASSVARNGCGAQSSSRANRLPP